MTSTTETLFQEGETLIELTADPAAGFALKFSGVIEHADPGQFLDPLLLRVHQAALDQGVPQVSADFTQLSFLNSSGIKAFVKWVMSHQQLDATSRYRIQFVYAPAVTWQPSTLKALVLLSRGAITLQAL